MGLISEARFTDLTSLTEHGRIPTELELDRFIRGLGYISPDECKQCLQRQIDSDKILNREAVFEEEQLRDEVEYWKGKNYSLGG